jgi:hypothetical protein
MTQKDSEALRRKRVRELFLGLPAEKRTEAEILSFYNLLFDKYPELLPSTRDGHPYQWLMVDLLGLTNIPEIIRPSSSPSLAPASMM